MVIALVIVLVLLTVGDSDKLVVDTLAIVTFLTTVGDTVIPTAQVIG